MSDLQAEFEAAVATSKTFTKHPTNEEKLTLYAFYKQATIGDCNTPAPGMFDLTGKAKWNAWNEKKGLTKEEAMEGYVTEISRQSELYL